MNLLLSPHFLPLSVSPEKEKPPSDYVQPSSLPAGVQDIFATEEEPDTTRIEEDMTNDTSPVSGAEMLQRAVDSISLSPPLALNTKPIMSPGSPRLISEEFSHNGTNSPAESFSSSTTKLSPPENISLPSSSTPALPMSSTANAVSTPHELSVSAPEPSPTASFLFLGDSTISLTRLDSSETRESAPSPEAMLPLSMGSKAVQPIVGMVEPSPQPAAQVASSSTGLLLHDFRPQTMLSTYLPTNQEPTHSFHNILSSVFLNSMPCNQKSLLQAMAHSLEHKGYQVLHDVLLPEDPGLQPHDLFHMAMYLYVSILHDEFEDHVQHENHEKRDYQSQLGKERQEHEATKDKLVSLRQMNSLLSKSNSPTEREQIFRLQQETRKTSQALQATTQDYNEVKALSETLQAQVDTTVKHRDSAVQELQQHLTQLQATASELSHLKIKMASMVDSEKVSAETVQLKSHIHQLSLDISTSNQKLEEVAVKAQLEETQSKALLQEKEGLLKDLQQSAERLREAEKAIKSLQMTKTELSVQVKELSNERDSSAPFLADAKLNSKVHQRDKVSWAQEKKSLCQEMEVQNDKVMALQAQVTSLTTSLDNHKKKKDKSTAEVLQELAKSKELVDQLNLEKANFLRNAKKDGEIFFAEKDAQDQREKKHEEALKQSQEQATAFKDEAAVLAALKISLEEERNSLTNTVLDLQEKLQEKSKKRKGKKRKVFQKLVKLLQDKSSSASDTNSDEYSEDEPSPASTNILSRPASPVNITSPPSPASIGSPTVSMEPEKVKTEVVSYCDVAKRDTNVSQGSTEDLKLSIDSEDRFPADLPTEKRKGSPRPRSSSPRTKSARPGSSERSVSYNDFPQREMQVHYDLDYMSEPVHGEAFPLIRKHAMESAQALSCDRNLIRHLRGPDSEASKDKAVQTILKTYAQCVSLTDISDLNEGSHPSDTNSYLPLPNLSSSAPEWDFIKHKHVKNHLVHFPSLMALLRLYCSKLYAFFHFGNASDQTTRDETISLLHTADRDKHGERRSNWEKKLDILLVLIVGRVVFYTLDEISAFDCNRDNQLHISAPFLTEDFVEQMVSSRTYRDPFLLPRRDMYSLYVDCNGRRARGDLHNRISRYEPNSPRHSNDAQHATERTGASWMDKI